MILILPYLVIPMHGVVTLITTNHLSTTYPHILLRSILHSIMVIEFLIRPVGLLLSDRTVVGTGTDPDPINPKKDIFLIFLFRSPAKGRLIGFLNLDDNGNPTNFEQIFWGLNPGDFNIRPVAVVVGPCKAYGECIFFTDDQSWAIHALAYVGPNAQPPLAPTSGPVAPPVAQVEIGQPVTL